jgi:hypothetical protein
MLGEKLARSTGKMTGQRVLPNPGGVPRTESSVEAKGQVGGGG